MARPAMKDGAGAAAARGSTSSIGEAGIVEVPLQCDVAGRVTVPSTPVSANEIGGRMCHSTLDTRASNPQRARIESMPRAIIYHGEWVTSRPSYHQWYTLRTCNSNLILHCYSLTATKHNMTSQATAGNTEPPQAFLGLDLCGSPLVKVQGIATDLKAFRSASCRTHLTILKRPFPCTYSTVHPFYAVHRLDNL